MSYLKRRPSDQPIPIPNDHTDIQTRLIALIKERRQIGIDSYGTALQPFNGRDCLRDSFEEDLDLTIYLPQVMIDRDLKREQVEERIAVLICQGKARYRDAPPEIAEQLIAGNICDVIFGARPAKEATDVR